MTTSNHVLAGTIIAVVVKQPALAIPLALISHFVMDALPHHGYDGAGYSETFKHKSTYFIEALGIIGMIALLSTGIYGWNLVLLTAIVAVSPDFEWPYRYFIYERKGLPPESTILTRFHKKIQWCERSWALPIEIVFFIAGFALLVRLIG